LIFFRIDFLEDNMDKFDEILKNALNEKNNIRIDTSSQILNRIEQYEIKKENLRFSLIFYIMSSIVILFNGISLFMFDSFLINFKIFLDYYNIDADLVKIVMQIVFISILTFMFIILSKTFFKRFKRKQLNPKFFCI